MTNDTTSESRAWYDKKRFLIPLLVFVFPVGLYALWKNNNFSRQAKLVIAGATLLFAIFAVASEKPNPSSTQTASVESEAASESEKVEPEKTQAEIEADERAEYIERVERELNSMEDFDTSEYTGSQSNILSGVAVFSTWATIAEESEEYNLTEEQQGTVAEFKKKISDVQKRSLPQMRDAYGPAMREALWEYDMEAKTFGSGYRTIRYIGGTFAANRNIKEFQTSVSDVLRQLRFDQARYKWYEGEDEYTYYDIDSPDDNELIIWQEGGRYRTVTAE